jgi:hypothetical protein
LQTPFSSAQQTIPARVVIGVTGHRALENETWWTGQIQSAIETIRGMLPHLTSTPLSLTVLSPLAEGADRLVVREVLKVPGAMLEVVLPFKQADYIQDFNGIDSIEEFKQLLSQAINVTALPTTCSRTEAYEQVGRYIVDQCDVLVALWDGKPAAGKGGTEEIVQYARKTKCPLIWIQPQEKGQAVFELGRGLNPQPFDNLDRYNKERINPVEFNNQFKTYYDFLSSEAERAHFSFDDLTATLKSVLGCYVRADNLALRFQRLHFRADSVVYALALAAVIIAAFQILFLPDLPIILMLEIILMLTVLTVVIISRRMEWHSRWIDYRFLAERFRSSLFMLVAGIDVTTLRPPRHLSLAYSPRDWIVAAFLSAWRKRPKPANLEASISEGMRQFVCDAWLEEQIDYHNNASRRNYTRYHTMNVASYIMFGLTIGAAFLDIANVGSQSWEKVFSFMAIVFPAVAASITAIRMQRDYLRNAMRSAEMVRHLTELKDKMLMAPDYDSFVRLLKETEETMLHENEDWRIIVKFHMPEVPV